jgi:fermentation-respiration switch protein FrsA (DUF1100 family)
MIVRRFVLAVLALALVSCGGSSSPPPAEPDGPFAVGQTSFVFVDTSRPTAAHNGAPGKDSRTLPTMVYYPAAGTAGVPVQSNAPPMSGRRFPLIVFAHGLDAFAQVYSNILQAWAAAGYVVAGPNFPLSSGATPGGPVADDYINQPADESFVLDQVLQLDRDQSSLLHDLIDAEQIGASGQSLGGMTTFGIAFNTCCRDRRIRAAVPMAGQLVPYPAGEYEPEIGPPVLIIHGDADDTVPYQNALDAYAFALPPKLLLTHLGGGHILPYIGGGAPMALAATIDASTAFFDLFLKHERGALERLIAVGTREGVVTLTYDLHS